MALVALAWIAPTFVHGNTLESLGYGLALAIVMLSLVPLIGYAGQISLAQLGFAGLGAVVMFKVGASGNPLALVAVVAITAAIGALDRVARAAVEGPLPGPRHDGVRPLPGEGRLPQRRLLQGR